MTQRRSRPVKGKVVALVAVVAVGSVELAGVSLEAVLEVLVGAASPLGVAVVVVGAGEVWL
jgi:hypothetical protein